MLWGRMEMAKRRLIYTLLRLGITLPSKAEDPRSGLAFDIVSTQSNPTVTTGHLNGVITVNLEEADDTYRQFNRQQLGESSRTLLGHFRHESAHYFWQRCLSELAWDDPLRLAFRERFGDEWLDYASALSLHYQQGAPAGWEQDFITGYAASHPWEDWAETWAHYLQILDGLETCESLGIQVQFITLPLDDAAGRSRNPAGDAAAVRIRRRRVSCLVAAVDVPVHRAQRDRRQPGRARALSIRDLGAGGAKAAAGASHDRRLGRGRHGSSCFCGRRRHSVTIERILPIDSALPERIAFLGGYRTAALRDRDLHPRSVRSRGRRGTRIGMLRGSDERPGRGLRVSAAGAL